MNWPATNVLTSRQSERSHPRKPGKIGRPCCHFTVRVPKVNLLVDSVDLMRCSAANFCLIKIPIMKFLVPPASQLPPTMFPAIQQLTRGPCWTEHHGFPRLSTPAVSPSPWHHLARRPPPENVGVTNGTGWSDGPFDIRGQNLPTTGFVSSSSYSLPYFRQPPSFGEKECQETWAENSNRVKFQSKSIFQGYGIFFSCFLLWLSNFLIKARQQNTSWQNTFLDHDCDLPATKPSFHFLIIRVARQPKKETASTFVCIMADNCPLNTP